MNKSSSDPVTHAELQAELQRLRSAIMFLATCVGPNVISQKEGIHLAKFLAAPELDPNKEETK